MDSPLIRRDTSHSAPRQPPLSGGIPQFPHGGNVYAFAYARGLQPKDVLDFSASINPLGRPRSVAAAYRRTLSQTVHYPEPYAETLTATLAHYHALDPASLIVGNGSTQLIYLLARVLNPQKVLIVSPAFSEYEAAFRLIGAQVSRLFLRPPTFLLSLEQLPRKLSEGYDVIVVANPNSPTGVLLPRTVMEETARLCRHSRVQLIIDEAFIDWAEEESLKALAARNPSILVLRSMTKFFALPGLRVGYAIAHPRFVARLRQQIEPWSVNTVAQAVAVACVNDARFIDRSRAFMTRERRRLAEQLTSIAGVQVFPSQANFLLAKVTQHGLAAADVAHQLANHNILIRDCANFPGLGKQFFRVAVRRRAENKRLLAALHTVFGGKELDQM
jgi:threonine-phosphate decarboxylase